LREKALLHKNPAMSSTPWNFRIAQDEKGYYWQRLNLDGTVHSDGERRFQRPGEARDEAGWMDGEEASIFELFHSGKKVGRWNTLREATVRSQPGDRIDEHRPNGVLAVYDVEEGRPPAMGPNPILRPEVKDPNPPNFTSERG